MKTTHRLLLKVPLTMVTFLGMQTKVRAGVIHGKLLLHSYCFKHGYILHHRLALTTIISMRLLGAWGF